MEVVITEWALQSYLDLRAAHVFSRAEYKQTIRPDVVRLKSEPTLPLKAAEFQNHRFWSAASDRNGIQIPDCFKMKWHQMGPGRVQLRVGIVMAHGFAYLCRAYVKDSQVTDWREMARLKVFASLIRQGKFTLRGKL